MRFNSARYERGGYHPYRVRVNAFRLLAQRMAPLLAGVRNELRRQAEYMNTFHDDFIPREEWRHLEQLRAELYALEQYHAAMLAAQQPADQFDFEDAGRMQTLSAAVIASRVADELRRVE